MSASEQLPIGPRGCATRQHRGNTPSFFLRHPMALEATGPPKRSAPGRGIAGAAKLRLAENYHSPIPAQACFPAWKRHGEWLLARYRHAGKARDWKAYCIHVAGIAARLADRIDDDRSER